MPLFLKPATTLFIAVRLGDGMNLTRTRILILILTLTLGLQRGDRISAVNGCPVDGLDVATIGSMVASAGTSLILIISTSLTHHVSKVALHLFIRQHLKCATCRCPAGITLPQA